jgi:hypothetical protein
VRRSSVGPIVPGSFTAAQRPWTAEACCRFRQAACCREARGMATLLHVPGLNLLTLLLCFEPSQQAASGKRQQAARSPRPLHRCRPNPHRHWADGPQERAASRSPSSFGMEIRSPGMVHPLAAQPLWAAASIAALGARLRNGSPWGSQGQGSARLLPCPLRLGFLCFGGQSGAEVQRMNMQSQRAAQTFFDLGGLLAQ